MTGTIELSSQGVAYRADNMDGVQDSTQFTASLSGIGVIFTNATSGFGYFDFQASTIGTGCTWVVEESLDGGTTWFGIQFMNITTLSSPMVTSANAALNVIFRASCGGTHVRVRQTTSTGGTTNMNVVFKRGDMQGSSIVLGAVAANLAISIRSSSLAANGSTPVRIGNVAASGSIKTLGGVMFGFRLINTSAATRYLQLYNKNSAPMLGTDTPVVTIPIQAGQNFSDGTSLGWGFSAGLAWAVTTDNPAVPAVAGAIGDIMGTVEYG